MRQVLVWSLALLVAGVSGCAEEEPSPTTGTGADPGAGNATVPDLAALLEADQTNGSAPLLVNFTISAEGPANATWSLDFGDGNSTEGGTVPAQANHTFQSNATVVLTVTAGNQTASASRDIVVAAAAAPEPALPEETHFEFGESLGCAGDVLALVGEHCLSAAHPDDSGIDGFWLELGAAYWGWALTTTVDNGMGDSDCYFTDQDLNVVAAANNGSGACEGIVPEKTAWLFLYSYAAPALGQTADFSPA